MNVYFDKEFHHHFQHQSPYKKQKLIMMKIFPISRIFIRQQNGHVYLFFFSNSMMIDEKKGLENQAILLYPSCSNNLVRLSSACLIRSKAPRARVRRGLGAKSTKRLV